MMVFYSNIYINKFNRFPMSIILYVLKFMEVTLQTRAGMTLEQIYPRSVRTFTERYRNIWGYYEEDVVSVRWMATPAERKIRKSFYDIFNDKADYSGKRIHFRIKISPENMRKFFIFLNSDLRKFKFELENITTSEVWFLCTLVVEWFKLFVRNFHEEFEGEVKFFRMSYPDENGEFKTLMMIKETKNTGDERFRTLTLTRP